MIQKLRVKLTNGRVSRGRTGARPAKSIKPAGNQVVEKEPPLPPLPPVDEDGNYPASEAIRVSIARTFIRRRRAAKLTQAELAKHAGIRLATLQKLEAAEHVPGESTLLKIEAALEKHGS